MTIQSSGPIYIQNLQTEFGGSNPVYLHEYYKNNGYIATGVYAPNNIPSSGPIYLSNFYGSEATHHYYGKSSNNYTYNANYAFSLDYFNGALRLNIGYWGSSANNSTWSQLQYKSSSSKTAQYSEIAQFTLRDSNVNTIQYGTIASGNMLYYGAQIFSNPVLAYGQNIAAQTGQGVPVGSAPGAAWMVAARYNGGNSVTVYLNAGRNGTGDTGSSISMSNLGQAFGEFAGSYQVQNGTTKGGSPIYETRYYTDFTFTF